MKSSLEAIEAFQQTDPESRLTTIQNKIDQLNGDKTESEHEELLQTCKPTLIHIQELTARLDKVQESLKDAILDLYLLKTDFLLLRDPEVEDRVLETLSLFGC
eukprot:GHVN01054384.1.p2 GENE.GHVN01054384.1~~GHVN01054384.1.p2  ORF type:complete len:103 (+),score=15.05 GHVN01054384.1:637-945(+)